MKSNEVWIPFDPAPVDVVSTKLRTWNLSHPGNLYYTDLVNNNVAGLDKDDFNEIKRRAEEIVYAVTVERGGRFLRPPDGDMQPSTCVVLDGKLALAKVVHALRTAQSRQELDAGTAHRILDLPLEGQSPESESDLERRVRLQLRHRFAAAAAIGMSPLEFASRLLKLWEGKLVTTKRRPKPKPTKSSLEDGTSTVANSVPSTTLQTPTTISLSPPMSMRLEDRNGQSIGNQSATPMVESPEAVPIVLESNTSPGGVLDENKHDISYGSTDQTLPAPVPSNESSN